MCSRDAAARLIRFRPQANQGAANGRATRSARILKLFKRRPSRPHQQACRTPATPGSLNCSPSADHFLLLFHDFLSDHVVEVCFRPVSAACAPDPTSSLRFRREPQPSVRDHRGCWCQIGQQRCRWPYHDTGAGRKGWSSLPAIPWLHRRSRVVRFQGMLPPIVSSTWSIDIVCNQVPNSQLFYSLDHPEAFRSAYHP